MLTIVFFFFNEEIYTEMLAHAQTLSGRLHGRLVALVTCRGPAVGGIYISPHMLFAVNYEAVTASIFTLPPKKN